MKKESIWNTRKSGGWTKYLAKTESNVKFKQICINIEELTIDEADQMFEKELKSVKFASFGKVKVNDSPKLSKEISNLKKKKQELVVKNPSGDTKTELEIENIDKEIVKELASSQKEHLDHEIVKFEQILKSKGNAARIFSLKNEIVGAKKISQEPTVIKNPASGEMITNPEEIKETVLKFCKDLLTNREPSEGFETDMIIKRKLHDARMMEEYDDDVDEISLEMFNECLEYLWKKKGRKYEFIMKAGYDLKNALFCIFNAVWKREKIPTSWKKTKLVQIFKGKGDFHDLSCQRNLHLKEDVPKVFRNIVVQQAQHLLAKNMSIYQIGTKKGHRATEHIYVLKTVLRK